jgi:hypothetical protein
MTVRFKETSWEEADSSMFEGKAHRPSYTRHIRNSHHSTYQDGYEARNEDEEVFVPASYAKPRTQQEIDQELDNFWKWLAKSREEYK